MWRLLRYLLALLSCLVPAHCSAPSSSMGITFIATAGVAGQNVTVLNPSLPLNPSGSVMLAWGNITRFSGSGRPVVTPPAGWTLVEFNDTFGLGNRLGFCYYKLGNGSSGTVAFTFDLPITGNIDIISYDEVNTTSPIKDSSFKNNSLTINPFANAVDTTGTANCMLVCGWMEGGDNYYFSTTAFASVRVDRASQSPFVNSVPQAILVADGIQVAAGSSGTKTALSAGLNAETGKLGTAFAIMVALAPAPNPSVPVLTFPNGGEALTAGSTVSITWSPATSPTAAQNTLKYNLDYSANNGSTWTQIVALTAVGVTSHAWTVPATLGTGYLVRIRANDPALSLFSLAYDQSDATFSVVAETTPGQPTITAPTAGSIHNKAVNVTVSWMHQGGVGNPQTEFTLQWDDDPAFGSPTTVGPTSTGTQSTSIDFSGQASGTTINVRVKTRGVSLESAYSNTRAFIVASVPATPNITAPVAASPPTVPLPTVTFTSADSFVARRFRVGTDTFEVASSATSSTSPYTFLNGVPATFFLSVKNSFGLWSAEDTETVTPAYAGPATPTLSILAVSDGGYVLATIANSDTPSYNELHRYNYVDGRATAIKVGATLSVDPSFADSNVTSGVVYKYFARAYASTGLFSDSADSDAVYLELQAGFLHVISRTSTSGNASDSTELFLQDGTEFGLEEVATSHHLLGRTQPVGVAGQATWQTARIVGVGINDGTLEALMAIWRQGAVVCLRSQAGHRLFGKMTEPSSSVSVENVTVDAFSFTVTEEDYTEGL